MNHDDVYIFVIFWLLKEGDAEKGSYDQSAGEESDRETEDKVFVEKEHPSKKAVKKSRKAQSSDEEEEGKTEEEKQQELVSAGSHVNSIAAFLFLCRCD